MRVLVVAAHPDDEVYGMGGTIAKLADHGHEIHVLIVTDGCISQYRNEDNVQEIIMRKQEEAHKANSILGVESVHFGNLPDMGLDKVPHIQINYIIEELIQRLEPEEVYTHFYGDVNLDHQLVYKSTLVATRPIVGQCVKNLYAYSVPSSTEWSPKLANSVFMPNVFVEIEPYTSIKLEAIKAYITELREYPHPRSVESVKKNDAAIGIQCGLSSAEGFMLLRSVIK
jgi:LmbE family N-acetylglucosaminyl deacetylase